MAFWNFACLPLALLAYLVRKLDGSYWLVQALRGSNQILHSRHPILPKPYILLSRIPPDHQWFSVVDLKDAFWTCRDTEWEDPQTGRKQQYQWTVLPQVFTDSHNLFGQILE
jgi:hypothetical protein